MFELISYLFFNLRIGDVFFFSGILLIFSWICRALLENASMASSDSRIVTTSNDDACSRRLYDNTKQRWHCKDSAFTRHIIARCPLAFENFSPIFWARSSVMQTVLPFLLPPAKLSYSRQYLLMCDNGVIALDWVHSAFVVGNLLGDNSTIMLVLDGFAFTPVSHLCEVALQHGYRPVVFNRRGHRGSFLTTPKLQGFGDASDLREAIKYIKAIHPKARIVAAGFCFGADLLMSYLGEFGSSAHLSAAVCISPCYDARELFDVLSKTTLGLWGSLWRRFFLFIAKQHLFRHWSALTSVLDPLSAADATTLNEFESLFSAKLNGFNSLADYWEDNNPLRGVDDIAVPVLCIHSKDDQLVPPSRIPYELFTIYPNLMLLQYDKGGYGGFIAGADMEFWTNRICLEYFSAVLNFRNTRVPTHYRKSIAKKTTES